MATYSISLADSLGLSDSDGTGGKRGGWCGINLVVIVPCDPKFFLFYQYLEAES